MITLVFQLLDMIIRVYIWAIILSAVFSMLASFNIIDTRNRVVWSIGEVLYRVTEPVLRPIRRILPNFGPVDLSPWVAIILLRFVIGPLIGRIYAAITEGSWHPLVF